MNPGIRSRFSFPVRPRPTPADGLDSVGGRRVFLTGLPSRILEILMRAEGEVVTRPELKAALWSYAFRIDTDRRLNTAVRALRKGLGESAGRGGRVETIRGHGYRWVDAMEVADNSRPSRRGLSARVALALITTSLLIHSSTVVVLPGAGSWPLEPAGATNVVGHDGKGPIRIVLAHAAVDRWRQRRSPRRLAEARAAIGALDEAAIRSPAVYTLGAELALGADWDWARSETLYKKALAMDPGDAAAHHGLAWLYVNAGRKPEAWREAMRLLSTMPATADSRADLGWLLLRLDRAELAAAICKADGDRHLNRLSCRHSALARLRKFSEARRTALRLMSVSAAGEKDVASVEAGDADEGYRRFLVWRASHFGPRQGQWFERAQMEAEAGNLDRALDYLQRARVALEPSIVKIRSTAAFAPLSAEPAFQDLVEEVFHQA